MLYLHINPVLLRNTSLTHRSFILTTHLVSLVFLFGNLGFLVCDLGVVVCPFVRVQDACEVLEFSAGLLVLHEGATLGIEGVQLGGYFLGKQGHKLVDTKDDNEPVMSAYQDERY